MQARDDGSSAAELVVTVVPPDDAGARTADLYEWQALMAAADGLRMYVDALDSQGELTDAGAQRIICERHEDWVVVNGSRAELVSAKHQGLAFGAYTTMNSLASDGGLAHLFDRWLAMEEKVECRLVTTAGMSGPSKQLEAVTRELRVRRLAGRELTPDNGFDGYIAAFGKALLKHCDGLSSRWLPDPDDPYKTLPSAPQRDQIARFLSTLRFQISIPKAYVGFAAPNMFAKPVLDRLAGMASTEAIWEAVASLFRVRMRAAGPSPTGGLPKVMAYPIGAPGPTFADLESDLASRIVTLEDIHLAIRQAMDSPKGFAPLPRMARTGRLAVKMEFGGCSDNSIERAQQLERDYRAMWRERLSNEPTARSEHAQFRRTLLRVSDKASSAVKAPGSSWGAALWRELQAEVTAQSASLPNYLDDELALGGLCDLSSSCQLWFSDSFDVDAEIERRRSEQGRTNDKHS